MASAAAAAAAAQLQQSQHMQRQQQLQEQAELDGARHDALAAFAAEEAASEVVELVVDQATDVMIGNHLDRLAIPYTVRCVVKEALDFVRCAFVGRDDGHVTDAHWHVDPLAPRVTVDPWARAAVSVAEPRQKPLTQAEIDANTAAAVASQSQVHSRRAPAAGTSKRPGGKPAASTLSATISGGSPAASAMGASTLTSKGGSGAAAGASGSKKGTSAKSGKAAGNGAGSGAAGSSAAGGDGGAKSATPPPATMSLEEQEYLEAAKAEQRRRAEVRATHDRVARQLDEFKPGTNFTIDGHTGKVVPIASFDGARRGAGAAGESRYHVGGPPQAPADLGPVKAPAGRRGMGANSAPAALTGASSASVLASPTSPANAAPTAGASTRAARARKPEPSDFYHEEASYGPMIDPSALAAAGGVTMRDKDAVSKGGDVRLPKSKMTRQEYQKLASAQQSIPIDDGFEPSSPTTAAVVSAPQPPADDSRRNTTQLGQSSSQPQQASTLAPAPRPSAADFKTQGVASLPAHKRASALAPLPTGAKPNDSSPRSSKREAAKKFAAQTTPQRSRSKTKLRGDPDLLFEEDE